jgi:tetratricopeptide (TPR) repeat protein
MRFVPDLIPKNRRVLPEYFRGEIYTGSTKNNSFSIIYFLGAVLFFISAIAFINHPLLTFLFGSIGIVLLPQGNRWIEKQLRFRLTSKIKLIFGAVLFVIALPLVNYYQDIDNKKAFELKVKTEKEAAEKLAEEQKEKQRKDSLNFYLQEAASLEQNSKIDEALTIIYYTSNFSPTEAEQSEIDKTKNQLLATKTFALIAKGKYKAALPELTNFLNSDPNNSELLYNRALCYSKTGKIQAAVNDLQPLLQLGNEAANKLYEKINPVRKRIIGYETLCCDGTTSSARGRGACSWHGGVCNWNHPIYEESRKYE